MDSFNKNSDFSQAFFRNGQYNALVQKLINQINNIIHHLLGYITTVYQFHGINFSVLHYQSQLLRMLIPYEIFDNLRLNDHNDLISQNNPFSQKRFSSDTFSIPIFNQNYFPNLKKSAFPEERINSQKRFNSQKRDLNKLQKLEVNETQKLDNDYQISNPKKRNYKLSCGGRPILEPYQQQEVKKFIHSEAMKGNLLTMQIIGTQAKRIAKGNDNFLGSIGWVKNFFKRFPKMKQYYLHSKEVRASNYKQSFKPQTNSGDPNFVNHNNNYMNEYKRRPSQQEQYPKINAKEDQQSYLIEEGQKIYDQSEEFNEPGQQYNYQQQNSYQSERNRKSTSEEKNNQDQQAKRPKQKEEKKPNEELSSYEIKKIPSKTYQLKTFKPYI